MWFEFQLTRHLSDLGICPLIAAHLSLPLCRGKIIMMELSLRWINEPAQCPAGQTYCGASQPSTQILHQVFSGGSLHQELLSRGLSICISNYLLTTCLARPLRTCLVIDVIPLRNFFEFLGRKVFYSVQLVVFLHRANLKTELRDWYAHRELKGGLSFKAWECWCLQIFSCCLS